MNEEGPSLAQPNVSPVTSSESQTQFKKDLWTTPSQNAAGGQMITLSPPAGDPAGSQPEPGQGSSSAGSELTGDAEGVWSVDIDQAFQEALSIYPPCGRRKIIISDEGKMYGRNELIARYIKLRCGKTRTRKQVSSHIQVLARKKARDEHTKKKTPELPLSMPTPVAVSSAPTTTTARVPNIRPFPQLPTPLADAKERLELLSKAALLPPSMYQTIWPPFPMQNTAFPTELKPFGDLPSPFAVVPTPLKCESPVPAARKAIASSRLMLNGFTAYFEKSGGSADDRVEIVNIPPHVGDLERLPISDISDKYPKLLRDLFAEGPSDAFFLAKCWANTHFEITDADDIFAVDSYYTSESQFDISVSTKVCSFGNQVVEKIEVYPAEKKDDQFAFRLEKSAMCDYMVKFITELKKLDSEQWMNNVLENFTVLQVVTSTDTKETLMVLCFVFEVNTEPASMCSLFRLVQ